MEVILEVWGDFACFSKPESKVERLTYPVPTPSAVRGILSSIYAIPREFVWQVNRIEVLKPIFTDDDRTQRQTVALRDVRYRFAASICPRPDFDGTETQMYAQALRKKARPRLSLYRCVMKQGVIQVPPYDSPEVLKGDAVC